MLSQRPVVEGSCEEGRGVREEVWHRRRSWGEVTTIDPCCNMRLVILFTWFHKIVIIQKTEVKWHKNHLLTLRVVVSSLYKMPTVERKFVRSTLNCELWLCEASPSWAGQVLVHCCQVRSFPFFKMFPFHTPSLCQTLGGHTLLNSLPFLVFVFLVQEILRTIVGGSD